MSDQNDIKKIKEVVEEFFSKATISLSKIDVDFSSEQDKDIINLEIKTEEPQILIGEKGQTLFEIQRILRMVLNKKLRDPLDAGKIFYLNLDINDYKKKKIEYLKDLAKDLADQVSLTGEEKILSPMSAYERRVIHAELSQRTDVITESRGEDFERCVVIKPK